ncbi:hypothetical protein QQP08_015513 [Theobroma cacao]|nr:hypothetical protein QQP08_015513 [Theobroma cacao]
MIPILIISVKIFKFCRWNLVCGGEKIIVFTTNYVDKRDPALIRRGRMDMHIELSYCILGRFKVLAKNYLNLDSHPLFEKIGNLLEEVNMTPADVSEHLLHGRVGIDPKACLESLIEALETAKEEKIEEEDAKTLETVEEEEIEEEIAEEEEIEEEDAKTFETVEEEEIEEEYFYGDGFTVRVPSEFEGIMEPEDFNGGASLSGDKAKPRTFAARFASTDGSEVLSVVIRPTNQLKITFLEDCVLMFSITARLASRAYLKLL